MFHQNEFNFENVVQKWQGFIDEINKEKSLTLAPIMKRINLLSLKGNNLNVFLDDSQNQKTFEMNEKYIENKSEIYFGKRLKFKFNQEESSTIQASPVNQKLEKQGQDISDPYEHFIVNELGGKKLEK
jgi:hypothetical protein